MALALAWHGEHGQRRPRDLISGFLVLGISRLSLFDVEKGTCLSLSLFLRLKKGRLCLT